MSGRPTGHDPDKRRSSRRSRTFSPCSSTTSAGRASPASNARADRRTSRSRAASCRGEADSGRSRRSAKGRRRPGRARPRTRSVLPPRRTSTSARCRAVPLLHRRGLTRTGSSSCPNGRRSRRTTRLVACCGRSSPRADSSTAPSTERAAGKPADREGRPDRVADDDDPGDVDPELETRCISFLTDDTPEQTRRMFRRSPTSRTTTTSGRLRSGGTSSNGGSPRMARTAS